ncbi:MAG: hypothetical protein KDC53_04445, partial [Saprospiraceae bacterium]|nr:hypothetical protein [Saprospiraceae bacterium]
MKALIYILATAAMISSCRSVEKLIDQGDFDTAMLKSMRKLSGKEQLKEKYVVAIEEAFAKATSRDMSYIKNQFDSERASDWYQIIERLRKIERRQNLLSPMLPLISREGRKADFAFIRTSLLLDSAIQQFHQFTLLDAEQLMEEARLGNKESARDAYYMLERLGEFSRPSTIVKDLQREARELGVTHISVGVQNRT